MSRFYIIRLFKEHLYALSLYARQISGSLAIILIARYMAVYDYGLFSSYRSIAVFSLVFANLSFADYILVSSKAKVSEVKLKISLFLVYALSVTFTIVLFSVFFDFESHLLFILILFRTFFDSTFFALVLPYFQAAKKLNIIAWINIIYSILIMLIAVIAYILKLSLLHFLILNVLLGLINFIQCTFYTKLNYLLLFKDFKRILMKIDKKIWDFVGMTLATYLYSQIAPLFISTMVTKEQAALYFSAFTIANVVMLLISAQTQKMVPEMIQNTVSNIRKILYKNLKYIMLVTSALFVFMLLFGKIVLKLVYGQEYYTNGYWVLLILMLANIAVAESSIFGAYIVSSNNVNKSIPILLQTAGITILALFLLKDFCIYGAATSFFIASVYLAYKYTTYSNTLLKQNEIKENIKETLCKSKN